MPLINEFLTATNSYKNSGTTKIRYHIYTHLNNYSDHTYTTFILRAERSTTFNILHSNSIYKP